MRSFTAQGNVRCIKWLRDGKHFLSSGDDAIINLWDVSQPSRTEHVLMWTGHGDSVRDVLVVHLKEENLPVVARRRKSKSTERYLMLTGSYDHSIRVWDLKSSLMLLNNMAQNNNDEKAIDATHALLTIIHHGAPVEALLQMTTNPREIISAGGTSMKLFDIISNSLVRENDSSHSKTITSLALVNMVGSPSVGDEQRQERLLSTGLDGFLRIYDPMTFHCLHGSKVPAPLLCVAASPFVLNNASSEGNNNNNRLLVTGSTDGFLSIRQRPRPAASQAYKREPRGGTYSYFMRSAANLPSADDYTVELQRIQRLAPFDKALRQFRYGEALDEALSTKTPQIVSAVLEELSKRRSGLEIALSNRDEDTLEPILAFCTRYIVQPRFAPLVTGVCHVLLDIYEDVLGQSAMIDELIERLRRTLLR